MAKNTGKKIIAGLVGTAIIAGAGVAGGMAIQNAYGKPDAGDNTQTEAPAVDYEKIELQEKLAKVQAQLTESQTLLQAKTTAYNQLKETTDAEIANLNEQITAKETAIKEANAELEQVTGNLTIAQETVATLTAEKENLESQLETETANKEAVQAQLNTVNAQLETAQETVATLTAQVEGLLAEKTQLITDKNYLQSSIDNLQNQLEDAEAEVVILNARIVELENALNEADPDRLHLLSILETCSIKCKLNDGSFLVGLGNSGNGIFYIDRTTYGITQLDSEHAYNAFKVLSNGNVLLGYTSNYKTGLRMFDSSTKSITLLIENYVAKESTLKEITELNDGSLALLLTSQRYYFDTSTLVSIDKSECPKLFQLIRKTLMLDSGNLAFIESDNGLIVLDIFENKFKLINSAINDYNCTLFIIDDTKLFATEGTFAWIHDTTSYEQLFYNNNLSVYSSNYYVTHDLMFFNDYSTGVRVIDLKSFDLTTLDSRSGEWKVFIEDENGLLISDGSNGSKGLYYNFTSKEILTTTGNNQLLKFVVGDNVYYCVSAPNVSYGQVFSSATGITETNYIFIFNDIEYSYTDNMGFNRGTINTIICNIITES